MSNGILFDSADLISVKIRTFNNSKEQDIRPQVGTINIYEDIDYPVVRADVTVLDAVKLISDFPIRGEERIEIKFRSKQIDRITTYNLIIYDVTGIVTTGTNSSTVYTFKCASEELYSNVYRVSRTYKDRSDIIVSSILTRDIGTSKSFTSNPAKGIQDITVPNLSPLSAIDFIRQRSVPQVGTAYLFYENQYGFHFRSIEDLVRSRASDSPVTLAYEYTFSPGAITLSRGQERYLNLLNIEYTSIINTTGIINGGSFVSRTKVFDIKTKSVETITTNSSSLFNNSTDFKNRLSDTNRDLKSYMLVRDGNKVDDYRPNNHAAKRNKLVQFGTESTRCHMYGNNDIAVGKFIRIKAPIAGVDTTEIKVNEYMVTRVRHIITNGAHPTYHVSAECSKVIES